MTVAMKASKILAIFGAITALVLPKTYADSLTVDGITFSCDAPFPDSLVCAIPDGVLLANHGSLLTSSSGGTDLRFSFKFTGNSHDSLKINLRGDGQMTNVNREFDSGIFASFRVMDDRGSRSGNVSLYEQNWPVSYNDLIDGTFRINSNQQYDIRVLDTGTCVSLFINDLDHPFLTINCLTDYGDMVGFSNREGAGHESYISTNSQVEISNISMQSVPDIESVIALMIPTLLLLQFFYIKFKIQKVPPTFLSNLKSLAINQPKVSNFHIGHLYSY